MDTEIKQEIEFLQEFNIYDDDPNNYSLDEEEEIDPFADVQCGLTEFDYDHPSRSSLANPEQGPTNSGRDIIIAEFQPQEDKQEKLLCRPFTCQCGSSFSTQYELAGHRTLYHSRAEFKCTHCPRIYKNINNLRSHEEDAHSKRIAGLPDFNEGDSENSEFFKPSNNSFRCNLCLKVLNSEAHLKIHVGICSLYHKDRLHFCITCSTKFDTTEALRNHCFINHGPGPGPANVLVPEIILNTGSNGNLTQVRNTSTESNNLTDLHCQSTNISQNPMPLPPHCPVRCSLCSKKLNSKLAFSRHLRVCPLYTINQDRYCVPCNIKFKRPIDFENHRKQYHDGPVPIKRKRLTKQPPTFKSQPKPSYVPQLCATGRCSLCSEKCNSREALERHLRVCALYAINSDRYCVPCNIKFRRPIDFENHLKQYHDGPEPTESLDPQPKPSDGPELFLNTGRNDNLTLVQNRSTDSNNSTDLPFQSTNASQNSMSLPPHCQVRCKLCSEKLNSEEALERHLRVCALNASNRDRYCIPCNVKFRRPIESENHRKQYHGPTESELLTKQPTTFKLKSETHHSCTIPDCCESFRASVLQNKPMESHPEVQRAMRSPSRRSHHRHHQATNEFKCHLCECSFFLRSTLDLHVQTHSEKRPFKCHYSYCGKSFNLKANLSKHDALVHCEY